MNGHHYATTSGSAQPLSPIALDQRFAPHVVVTEVLPDWMEEDPNEDRCTSHVLLYHGFDLSAASIWEHDIAPCLLCAPLPPEREPVLALTDEVLHWRRRIHFVCCGNCGTRGPWADSESSALAQWNSAHQVSGPAGALVERIESSTRTCTVLAEAMVQLLVACKLNGQDDLQAFLEQAIQLLNATGQANDLALAQAVR